MCALCVLCITLYVTLAYLATLRVNVCMTCLLLDMLLQLLCLQLERLFVCVFCCCSGASTKKLCVLFSLSNILYISLVKSATLHVYFVGEHGYSQVTLGKYELCVCMIWTIRQLSLWQLVYRAGIFSCIRPKVKCTYPYMPGYLPRYLVMFSIILLACCCCNRLSNCFASVQRSFNIPPIFQLKGYISFQL